MLKNHIISNLHDYITGVETGLDSHSRKNRGGHQMENLVAKYLTKSGVNFQREITSKELGLPSNFKVKNKRWDFAVKTSKNIYVIETNFYTDSGSKLNETARSYKSIAQEARKIPNCIFIWITDGKGWEKAKNNLAETFTELDTLYNIHDLESGIFDSLFI